MTRQKCRTCGRRLAITSFPMNGKYRRSDCRQCRNEWKRKWYRNDPEARIKSSREYYRKNKARLLEARRQQYHKTDPAMRVAKRREAYNRRYNTRLLYLYGIDEAQYKALLKQQNGRCAICNKKPSQNGFYKRISVDHSHETGRVRGLLCSSCNPKLGWFEKHKASVLQYLKAA